MNWFNSSTLLIKLLEAILGNTTLCAHISMTSCVLQFSLEMEFVSIWHIASTITLLSHFLRMLSTSAINKLNYVRIRPFFVVKYSVFSGSSGKKAKSKKYSATLNLPKTQFPVSLKDASTREKEIQSVSF